jgi:hypothetical protein
MLYSLGSKNMNIIITIHSKVLGIDFLTKCGVNQCLLLHERMRRS